MALVVESGIGMADAESYISVADATTRHASLGNAAWAALASDTVREQALRRATQYMLQAYRIRWSGERSTSTQALDWPRYGVVVDGYQLASDSIPVEVANACADLALKASAADLSPDLTRGVLRKKIGPLETEYDPNSPQAKRYTAIDRMLAPYLAGSSMSAMLVRT